MASLRQEIKQSFITNYNNVHMDGTTMVSVNLLLLIIGQGKYS